MIICFDVYYSEQTAQVAAVAFVEWEQELPSRQYTLEMPIPGSYTPGEFYKRELPCLLALWPQLSADASCLIVDGYVHANPEKPGLGAHLHQAIDAQVPVIGVAKSLFKPAKSTASPLLRGNSKNPLWISAIGMPMADAVDNIKHMHGHHRIPTLLKTVDALSRNISSSTPLDKK